MQAYAGHEQRPGFVTLDSVRFSHADGRDFANTFVKIDVEGAELDAISGAQCRLRPTNKFVLEVHKTDYLSELENFFAKRGLRLKRIDQRPLPIVGREVRDVLNWWLVSDIAEPR